MMYTLWSFMFTVLAIGLGILVAYGVAAGIAIVMDFFVWQRGLWKLQVKVNNLERKIDSYCEKGGEL